MTVRPVCFFLVFEGRCGSGLLRSLLNSSPRVHFEAEWLLHDLASRVDAASAQAQALSKYYTDPAWDGFDAVGVANKLRVIADRECLRRVLHGQAVRLISLKRRNVLKQVVSDYNAQRTRALTGKSHAYSKAEISSDPFKIPPKELLRALRSMERRLSEQDDFVAASGLDTLGVWYEDLVRRQDQVLQTVRSYLGIRSDLEPTARKRPPLKQTPDDLSSIILNFEELRRELAGTRYDEQLVEGAQGPTQ